MPVHAYPDDADHWTRRPRARVAAAARFATWAAPAPGAAEHDPLGEHQE